jgi:hypothetical protein
MELETMLVSLFVLVEDGWEHAHRAAPRKPGRPTKLSKSEVLTLAILARWPAFVASGTSSGLPTPISALTSRTS